MDEHLRNRYRRDFRRETTRPVRLVPTRPAPTPSVTPMPAQSSPTLSTSPAAVAPQPQPASLATPIIQPTPASVAPAAKPFIEISQPKLSARAARKPKVRRKGRLKKMLFAIFVLLILGSGGSAAYLYYQSRNVVPKAITSQAEIPILYPYQLPPGFQINKSSFNVTHGNIVAYYADNQAGDRILFTVQTKPANFDYKTFYSQGLQNATEFTTDLGDGAVGNTQGKILGSLTTDKTWILVSGNNASIDSSKVEFVLRHLKQIG